MPRRQKNDKSARYLYPGIRTLPLRQKMLQSQSPLIIFSDFTLHFIRGPLPSSFSNLFIGTVQTNQIFVKYRANQNTPFNYSITFISLLDQSERALFPD